MLDTGGRKSAQCGLGTDHQRAPRDARWRHVVCIASGPSLTREQVETVRSWRFEDEADEAGRQSGGERSADQAARSGRRGVVVANTSFQIAPWADALFAIDSAWWRHHLAEVRETFAGESFTSSKRPIPGVTKSSTHSFLNSGAGAIALAHRYGAENIVLLGYDCHRNGGAHWHGDHPDGLGNAGALPQWPKHFARLARAMSSVSIVNCSPGTALRTFPTMDLLDALDDLRRIESEQRRGELDQLALTALSCVPQAAAKDLMI